MVIKKSPFFYLNLINRNAESENTENKTNSKSYFPAKCLCVNCSHIWVAIAHKNRATKLECPECGEFKGAAIINYYEIDNSLREL